jgi:very-short-patch-repair endonuclease
MMYPGKAILLREHFRCVEPIIRFSSRFYENLLVPMRLPKSSERLDPPLVDVYIAHGQKNGDVNQEEADFIVSEIKTLVEDQAYTGRSIGVISLIGDKQANLIYTRIMRELGSEVVNRHRIMCGNASTFQGQERDIVFLSMVACPSNTISFKSRTYEQRFNVAMSRARDRAYLVRSVSSSDLKPGDLKLAIIEHFRDPYKTGAVAQNKSILDLCDSEFEKQFATRMIEQGYRIRAQVPVAGFRIDFVIEGDNDSRLAIELDGDKWHGPEKWAADFARQTALEKLGWQFWRCWGSSWMLDPEGCLVDLKDKLNTLGIRQIGADTKEYSATEFRQLTPDSLMESDSKQQALDSQTEGESPSDLKAEIGRLVIIRFEEAQNRVQRIRITSGESRPDLGMYSASDIYVQDILNKKVDDEVSIPFDSGNLLAHIEHIE